ncbi:MAG: Crp/Fnr family transcriptional regulator [Clostridia bacterium]|nr:Crp/Fnr family transcriptional regulator [Clostridia bacterium]
MDISTLFLFCGLTDREVAHCRTLGDCEERTYRKGAVIYDAGVSRRALAMVLEGALRVLHGKVVMKALYPGDVFGAAALFGSSEPYPSTVLAETDCRVVFIPQETVSAWMASVPRVGENYICFLSDRIRFLNRRLSTLTAGQTDGKLWRYLLAHRNREGVVHLSSGMTGLAETLDMGRSSLYRSLDSLIAAGRIRRQGKQIIVLKQEEES